MASVDKTNTLCSHNTRNYLVLTLNTRINLATKIFYCKTRLKQVGIKNKNKCFKH